MTDPFHPAYIHDLDIEITQGQDFVMAFRAMPETDLGVEFLEDTTGYSAIMRIRDEDWSGDLVFDGSNSDGTITLGFTPRKVARNTVYGVGQKVVPIALNGYVYECTVGGTSHASNQPTWPTTIGQTVSDGTVTWRCETTDETVANIYVHIPASETANMTDWGKGVYSLEVNDDFSHSWFYLDGVARLRQTANY